MDKVIDCLIVRQPFASLIAYGMKRWEFRTYNCKKRARKTIRYIVFLRIPEKLGL